MKKKREVVIQPKVFQDAEEIYNYIKGNSIQNAESFRSELIKEIEKIEANPEAFPPEVYLNSRQIHYRFSLVMKSWKLIFKLTNKLLIILGLIHTSRNPKEIGKLRSRSLDE